MAPGQDPLAQDSGRTVVITIRAALAVALFAGYRAGRHVVVWSLAAASLWTWVADPGWPAVALTALTVAAGAFAARTGSVLRRCAGRIPTGAVVPPRADSPLWNEVWSLSDELAVRRPDEIRIVADPVLEAFEQPRNLGLSVGVRYLYVGLPLLVGLPSGQLRALLTHELAHDSTDAGPLPAACYRIRHAIGPILARRPGVSAIAFAIVARIFLMLEAPVSRLQERIADRAAVRLNGRRDTVNAVRELPVLAVAWQRYLTEVLGPAVRSGYAPVSISDGFRHACQNWQEELLALRTAPPEEVRLSWDTHLPRLERLHAIDLAPEGTPPRQQADLASGLTPVIRQVETDLVGPETQRVPWDEFCAITASQALRGEIEQLFRTAYDVTPAAARTRTPGLDTVLSLIEAGALSSLVARLDPPTAATARRLLAMAFAQAAVDGGVARWRRTPSGGLRVVRQDGVPVPVEELAARVIVDPATVPMVREVLRAVQVGGVAHAHG